MYGVRAAATPIHPRRHRARPHILRGEYAKLRNRMTPWTAARALRLALLAGATLGCASGPVTGRVAMPGETGAAPLSMTWRSGLFGESGQMAAVLPDGERFSGKYQVVRTGMSRSDLEPAWTGDEPGDRPGTIDNTFWGAARDQASFTRTYLNRAIATLKGDRGTIMLCRFNLTAGGAGMRGGGGGECQTSRGAKITAQF
jgi:hypothetical protein